MNSLAQRVSYVKGLIDGMDIDTNVKEGKVISEIVDILSEISQEIELLHEDNADLEEYVDSIDEDLSDVEELLYDEEYDEDDYEDEDDDFVEIKCENCGETVYVDENIINNEQNISCPNCHKSIVLNGINDNTK